MDFDWNTKIKEALSRTEFLALSTIGEDGVWTNPVEYHHSEKFDIYFVSMMHSRHARNILASTAKHLTDLAEVEIAACYYGRNPGGKWHFFKITPTELWIFDSREFGEERVQVDIGALELF